MTNIKTCFKCGRDDDSSLTKCPHCGGAMKTPTTMRVLGVVLLTIGASLAGGMTVLIIWITSMAANSGNSGTGSRFTGSQSDLQYIYGLLGLVLVFGLASMTTGLWQIVFGRRNRPLTWIMLGLGVALLIVGIAFKHLT